MMFFNPEEVKAITPYWDGERMADGRPKVSDDLLRRMKNLNTEEIWAIFYRDGYKYQFENRLKASRPGEILVGRAVTLNFIPERPDYHAAQMHQGREVEGNKGFFHQWVIDRLEEHDVFVVDMFDKTFEGTIIGGNLATTIHTRTKDGGLVVWGGIRDLQQIREIEGLQVFYRESDPSFIKEVTAVGVNRPTKIGKAICMPGDIVFGTPTGVLFCPPQYAEKCVVFAEKTKCRDVFGFMRLKEGKYTGAQIDSQWAPEIWEDFIEWFKNDPEMQEYSYLDFTEDLGQSRKMTAEQAQQVRD